MSIVLGILLRLAAYVQLLLGLGRLGGFITNNRDWQGHLYLGVAIAILAIVVLWPSRDEASGRAGLVAPLFPLVPLAVGLGFTLDVLPRILALHIVHGLLGLMAIAFIEMGFGRRRRARRQTA